MTEIEPSTLRILNTTGQTIGTGFLVSNTLAVTCAHVVASVGAVEGDTVQVQFTGRSETIEALIEPKYWRETQKDDVAFLRLTVPEGILPLRLSAAKDSLSGNRFFAFGYASAAKIQGIATRGEITTLLPDGRLLQIRSHEADHGISGAPVFDEKRGVVVGMITKGHTELGRNQETTFATPTELLFEICPEIRPSEICPYLGLESFSAETERFFFGRKALTEKLLTTLSRGCRFLAVFGPSGSGKSSVVRAGLLPALKKSQPSWVQIIIRPADDPFAQLAAAGLDLLDIPPTKTILFIDQFEELFTCPEDTHQRFVRELAAALENSRLILIIAMRDDFYSTFNANAAPLAASSDKVVVDVPVTLERADLIAMIEQPAAAVGLALEEGLTDAIIKDATTDGAARSSTLPLLEFALTQLWDKRRDGLLTHDAYKSIGGVTGSLARWADDAYSDLSKADQPLAESLLTALVHLGDESQGLPDTRRRRVLTEFDAPTRRVIKHFTDQRLLITSGETVELVHDALVREWGLLLNWIENDRGDLRLREGVSDAARQWETGGKEESLLNHRGTRLELALEMSQKSHYKLNKIAQAYLEASRDMRDGERLSKEKERLGNERRRRLTIGISIAVAIIMVILGTYGLYQGNMATIQAATATFAQGIAIHQAATAEAAKIIAIKEVNAHATAQYNAEAQAATAEAAKATAISEAHIRATAQADADAQKREAEKQFKIAIARQFAAQSQPLFSSENPKQMTAVLLAIQSMKLFPNSDAAQILQKNLLARPIASMPHTNIVNSVAFSPLDDGKYVVSGGCDQKDSKGKCIQGSARVWNAATGKEIARMVHNGAVSSVVFSHDGKLVISGSADNTAHVWVAATGKEIARMTHGGTVNAVAFSPNGKFVVSGGCDQKDSKGNCIQGSARVWNAATGKEIARMTHGGDANAVAFSSDGKYVVSGDVVSGECNQDSNQSCPQGSARVWDATTGREISRMTHDFGVRSVAFSPDGKYVVSGSFDNTARVWDAATGKEISRMTDMMYEAWALSVAFSPDGRYVISGHADNTARVWEVATGKEISRMTHKGSVGSVAFSPDGRYVVSSSADNTARVWDPATSKEIARITHDDSVSAVAFSPDSRYVVSGSWDNTVRVWGISTRKEFAGMIVYDGYVNSIAFSPDGKYIVLGNSDNTIRVWEVAIGKEISRIRTHDDLVTAVAFSDDSKYVISKSNNIVRTWEVGTGKEIAHMTYDGSVRTVAFSPDGKYVVLGGCDQQVSYGICPHQGSARVWEVATGKELARMTHDGKVDSVAFSPNSKYVVSGSFDGTTRVWEVDTGKEIARMAAHDNVTYSVAFSPDSKHVVSGNSDNIARVWEVATGKEIARMTHDFVVHSVIFSPDGKYVVSGSWDNTARVWEAGTGKEIARMTHDGHVSAVAFSPDGKYVVSESNDGTTRVWRRPQARKLPAWLTMVLGALSPSAQMASILCQRTR